MNDQKTVSVDVCGDVCPMPVVKTKKALDGMASGDLLEVTGDYPLAKENILRLAEDLGEEVIEVRDEGHLFCVKIRRLTDKKEAR